MSKPKSERLQRQVARRLRDLRRRAKLSQSEVAEAIGVSLESVGRSERGLLSPSLPTIVALAELYGVTVDQVIGRARPQAEDDPLARTLAQLLRRLPEREAEAIVHLVKTLAHSRVPGSA